MYGKFLKVRGIFYGVLFFSVTGMLIISFFVKKVYVREVMLVPSLDETSQLQVAQLMRYVQLSGGLFTTPAQVFLDLASSYPFKRDFIKKYGLDSILEVKNPDDQVKILENKIKLEIMPSGNILLRVYDTDPERASRLMEWYVEFLNDRANYSLNAKGRELRKFLENRLRDVKKEISELQDSIELLEKRSKILTIAPEEILGPAIGEVLQKLAKKEVEYTILKREFSDDIPEVSSAKREVEALRSKLEREFERIPSAVRKAVRYKMELGVKSEVYATLYAEYEKARLMELKNTPMLQAASSPAGPQKKVWPKRVMPALGMVVGLAFSLTFALASFTALDRLRDTTLGKIVAEIRKDLTP